MPVINIIFWLVYTMKITMFYIHEKLLLFVGCRFHEEGERAMIYFETTHKRLYIHVFLTSLAQIDKCQ